MHVCWFVLLLGLSCALPANGESHIKRTWLRRLTLAAACAASIWDISTTRTAVAYGARERNPLFADRYGNPRWGRMIGLKVGLFVGAAAAQEIRASKQRRAVDWLWTGANASLAANFVRVSLHNRSVAEQLIKAQKPGGQ